MKTIYQRLNKELTKAEKEFIAIGIAETEYNYSWDGAAAGYSEHQDRVYLVLKPQENEEVYNQNKEQFWEAVSSYDADCQDESLN